MKEETGSTTVTAMRKETSWILVSF